MVKSYVFVGSRPQIEEDLRIWVEQDSNNRYIIKEFDYNVGKFQVWESESFETYDEALGWAKRCRDLETKFNPQINP